MPGRTGIVRDPAFHRHLLDPGHPEAPERLAAIERRLTDNGMLDELVPIAPTGDPRAAIDAVHPPRQRLLVEREARDPGICYLAVAGGLRAVDAVYAGTVRNAFCALRPPGHHATDCGEFGFCFFNNLAVAARHAQTRHGARRILIVDWDYHHGNGTEWAFYEDPSVYYFSTHHYFAFPGTGHPGRTGAGPGRGRNRNVALPAGAGRTEFLRAFEDLLLPAARSFAPDLVLVSAGFDARRDDWLGSFALDDPDFADLTRLSADLAADTAEERLVSFLEGGYDPEGLALAVEAHCAALLEA